MGKIILLVFVLLLFSSVVIAVPVDIVAAEGTIYIRADGSVDGTAAIRRDGNVYTFTGNVYGSIVVEKDNVVVDGAGCTLQGTGNGKESTYVVGNGVELLGRSNVTIKNMRIQGFYSGIYLNYLPKVYDNTSKSNIISGNYITNNRLGILVFSGSNNTILENQIINNNVGISLSIAANNTVKRNYIIANGRGIGFGNDQLNIITENYIAYNEVGLYFGGNPPLIPASNKLIYHNSFINNTKQVDDYHWTDSYSKPSISVWDDGAKGNYWSDYMGKDADGDGIGDTPYIIDENNRDNYPLVRNLISPLETTPPTVSVVSPENKAYASSNVSLIVVSSEPAVWIGYSLNGQDNVTVVGNTTLTGLVDGSYSLTVYALDMFENAAASITVHFTVDTVPPTVTLLSPQNQTYMSKNIPLTFTINEPASWMGSSLDGQGNVTITGDAVLTGLPNGEHNVTVYVADLAGNTGASETVYFSVKVPDPFPIVPVAAASTAVIIVVAGLLVYHNKRKREVKHQ